LPIKQIHDARQQHRLDMQAGVGHLAVVHGEHVPVGEISCFEQIHTKRVTEKMDRVDRYSACTQKTATETKSRYSVYTETRKGKRGTETRGRVSIDTQHARRNSQETKSRYPVYT
jgi:hypothetical protein